MMVSIILLLLTTVKYTPEINLGSLNGPPFCPGPVELTCVGTELAIRLQWKINDSGIGSFLFQTEVSSSNPANIPLTTTLPGLSAEVTRAGINPDTPTAVDITSVLRAENVSLLVGHYIQCGALSVESMALNVTLLQQAPSPSTSCFLFSSINGSEVIFSWPHSFNSKYSVERYRLSTIPPLFSCYSDQVNPSGNHSCSGLSLGTNYQFVINVINCGNQEGNSETFFVHPNAPQDDVEIEIFNIEDNTSVTLRIEVEWRELSLHNISERCYFVRLINYTVVLETSTGERVDQRVVSSDSCSEGICSSIFSILTSGSYSISISATNIFGQSNYSTVYFHAEVTTENPTTNMAAFTFGTTTDDLNNSDAKITLHLYQFILIIVTVAVVLLVFVVISMLIFYKFKARHKQRKVTTLHSKSASTFQDSAIYEEIQDPPFCNPTTSTSLKDDENIELASNSAYHNVKNQAD